MYCTSLELEQLPQAKPLSPLEHKPISVADIQKVHCAVEHFLLRRSTLDETAAALQGMGVPAVFTRLVWKQLEEQNPAFFQCYHRTLAARKQQGSTVESAARAA